MINPNLPRCPYAVTKAACKINVCRDRWGTNNETELIRNV